MRQRFPTLVGIIQISLSSYCLFCFVFFGGGGPGQSTKERLKEFPLWAIVKEVVCDHRLRWVVSITMKRL